MEPLALHLPQGAQLAPQAPDMALRGGLDVADRHFGLLAGLSHVHGLQPLVRAANLSQQGFGAFAHVHDFQRCQPGRLLASPDPASAHCGDLCTCALPQDQGEEEVGGGAHGREQGPDLSGEAPAQLPRLLSPEVAAARHPRCDDDLGQPGDQPQKDGLVFHMCALCVSHLDAPHRTAGPVLGTRLLQRQVAAESSGRRFEVLWRLIVMVRAGGWHSLHHPHHARECQAIAPLRLLDFLLQHRRVE
mmetsp:Transcript_9395/g.22167  ORF Transcript_9395/g.22167 Transcript_9395/m.22167 type:complete len:246 (-) Transcript_9395:112-849(-)